MTAFYYYLALLNVVVCAVVGVVVWWKNRYQAVGPLFGVTMLIFAVWCACFAQYFRPMSEADGLWWAKLTLTAAIINYPFYFHSLCALLAKMRHYRWWITTSYVTAVVFSVLLWQGQVVTGLQDPSLTPSYMAHYVSYNRAWYPVLSAYLVFWQWFGGGLLVYHAYKSSGYKRTQLIYFVVAWLVVFLSGNFIILPIEYGVEIHPFGFFILPFNLGFLAYVMAQARLADFNIVIPRVLLYTVTLLVIVLLSLLFIAGMRVVAPDFMDARQILFTIVVVVAIGLGLALTLPRLFPLAERAMQTRMFGSRFGYQAALSGLLKELSHLPDIEQMVATVVSRVHSEMHVTRAMILLQDPLSDNYELLVESGLATEERGDTLRLSADSAIVNWLINTQDALVRDELTRRTDVRTVRSLESELDRLKVALCIPMILDGKLTGLVALGSKISGEMFYVADMAILETLATEVCLAVKYRRMEEQISRQNRLIELGTIAAGVAHEIRNPLASIRTFAQLLPDRSDDPEFKNEFSKLVLKDVERITKVIETMLAFARPSQVTIAAHRITDLVEEAILLVQARLKSKRIELTRQFHEEPTLQVDKQQILQVLVNLLSNAVDAVAEQGRIQVSTGVRTLETPAMPGDVRQYGVIEITDNGHGIPANLRTRLFDPFFTTKKNGTGLGLSISQKIIRDHGGIITCSSIEGTGTTFQVNLPFT